MSTKSLTANSKKDEILKVAGELGITITPKMTKKVILDKIRELQTAEKFPEKIFPQHINTIIHLADIHIRNNKRHDEFREVFENVTAQINSMNPPPESTLIIFAGDIFDEGSRSTPSVEAMFLIRTWFKNLTQYGTLIVFPGNHDCRESNTEILEGLYMATIDIPNLIYLRESCHLIFNNITLSHSSLIDKKFITRKPRDTIAFYLYHGALNTTSAGHSTRFRREEDFANFNIVLLGDIHIRETWTVDSINTTFAYPGSLVQQNHGEDIDGHGFLVWRDFEDDGWTDEFFPVKNNYAHVSINVSDAQNLPTEFPAPNLYVRVVGATVDESALAELFRGKNIVEVKCANKTQCDFVPPKPITAAGKIESVVEECVGAENLARFHSVDQNAINAGKHSSDLPAQSTWTIRQLHVSGLFAFATPITLIMHEGITLISGRNGFGKTSLINALRYTLLHMATGRKESLKNKSAREYLANCVFEVDGAEYEITDQNGSFVNFTTGDGRKLNQGAITATYKQVENFIGTDWLQNCIFTFARENFLQYTPQRRLTEIKSTDFALTLWMSYENKARELLKAAKKRQDILLGKLSATQCHDTTTMETEYEKLVATIKLIVISGDSTHLPRDTSDQYLRTCRQTPRPSTEYDDYLVQAHSRQLSELNNRLYNVKLTDAELGTIRATANIDTYKIDERLAELEDVNHTISYDYQITQLRNNIATLKKLSPTKSSIDVLPREKCLQRTERKIPPKPKRAIEIVRSEIEDAKNNNMSPTEIISLRCELDTRLSTTSATTLSVPRTLIQRIVRAFNSIESPVDTAPLHAEIAAIEKYDEAVAENKLDVEHNRLVKLSLSHYKYLELITLESDLATLQKTAERAKLKSTLLSAKNRRALLSRMEEQEEIESEINSVRHKISELSKLKTAWTTYESAQREISAIHTARSINEKRILESRAEKILTDITTRQEMNKQRTQVELELKTVRGEISDLDFYISSCKKITTKLLHAKIAIISEFVNQFLDSLVPFRVHLQLNGDDKIDIEFRDSTSTLSVECLSGYQSFLYNLVFAAALNKYCAAKSARFLFIDECISMADTENISLLPKLFERLRTVYESIIVISHLPSIAEHVDQHFCIEISDTGKRSLAKKK